MDPKAPVHVARFTSSVGQGELRAVETVRRTIHRSQAVWPQRKLCAALPLRPAHYYWIWYRGERYAVTWDEHRKRWELNLLPEKK